mmetsp:Transcript_121722/g.242470  ORF Transcript_121722/g.242470 Transcript_121722/m.242470 type:complete len:231 (+) Transcript_121722:54-746(+)
MMPTGKFLALGFGLLAGHILPLVLFHLPHGSRAMWGWTSGSVNCNVALAVGSCTEGTVGQGGICTVQCSNGGSASPSTVICPSSGCDGPGGSCSYPDNGWWGPCQYGSGNCAGQRTIVDFVTCTLAPPSSTRTTVTTLTTVPTTTTPVMTPTTPKLPTTTTITTLTTVPTTTTPATTPATTPTTPTLPPTTMFPTFTTTEFPTTSASRPRRCMRIPRELAQRFKAVPCGK